MIPIAAAAQANAIKASGVIVSVTPPDFERIVNRIENPLVIASRGGFWGTKYHYLTSYRGFAFFTTSNSILSLPEGTEIMPAETIWMPQ
jgi:hypothetical protein